LGRSDNSSFTVRWSLFFLCSWWLSCKDRVKVFFFFFLYKCVWVERFFSCIFYLFCFCYGLISLIVWDFFTIYKQNNMFFSFPPNFLAFKPTCWPNNRKSLWFLIPFLCNLVLLSKYLMYFENVSKNRGSKLSYNRNQKLHNSTKQQQLY